MKINNYFQQQQGVPKKIKKLTEHIIKKEKNYQELDNETLQSKSRVLMKLVEEQGITNSIIIESYALVREAAYRILKMKAYPVQIEGALVLNQGDIAEMKTGEGKTLTSLFPVYLNALNKKGVHVVTVNNYLVMRDMKQLKPVYEFLGLTVGATLDTSTQSEKKEAYQCDITYGTHSEFGFDYLRDRLMEKEEQRVCRKDPYQFALIDEVDSVLIDEAKTPLIISGESKNNKNLYGPIQAIIRQLSKDDYHIDYNHNSVSLTTKGISFIEKKLKIENLYSIDHTNIMHLVTNALRANYILKDGVDYIVEKDTVKLIDKFTGRIMEGRQLEDGLQQALQAKEHVTVQSETTTNATITYQNFFRLYKKLSGMTGTAWTERDEFREIYNMNVIVIPTNKPNRRIDHEDRIFSTKSDKFKAILEEIKTKHATGQPLLIGVTSVEDSNYLSKQLKKQNIKHNVLNATKIASEAKIIAKAGQKNAVTIATNMAGRGTDIQLGENVESIGGLFVIGTEHNTARRIDNQLRGRSARQGDKGETVFYASFEDEIIKRFSNDKLLKILEKEKNEKLGLTINPYMKKQMDEAQIQIEGNDYNSRKNTLQYDVLIDQQRKAIYKVRDGIVEETNIENLKNRCIEKLQKANTKEKEQAINQLNELLNDLYPEQQLEFLKLIMLYSIDRSWTTHINILDKLRKTAQLKNYAQINPILAYQDEIVQRYKELEANTTENLIKTINTVIYQKGA